MVYTMQIENQKLFSKAVVKIRIESLGLVVLHTANKKQRGDLWLGQDALSSSQHTKNLSVDNDGRGLNDQFRVKV